MLLYFSSVVSIVRIVVKQRAALICASACDYSFEIDNSFNFVAVCSDATGRTALVVSRHEFAPLVMRVKACV